MLQITNLTVGHSGRPVLHGLTLSAPPGQLLGLIGPNGAGKTTLLRAIGGTLTPAAGQIRLGATDLTQLSAEARARRIAVVPQRAALPDGFSVGEVVLMGRTPHLGRFGGERTRDYTVAREAMLRTATWNLAERRVGELSGGEQQRVLIARALAQEPEVLLLDEATAHLDLKHQLAVLGLARELAHGGLVVIAALHDLNLAALYADQLALLYDGALLAAGTPAEVLTVERLRQGYAVTTIIGPHPRFGTPLVALAPDDLAEPPE